MTFEPLKSLRYPLETCHCATCTEPYNMKCKHMVDQITLVWEKTWNKWTCESDLESRK